MVSRNQQDKKKIISDKRKITSNVIELIEIICVNQEIYVTNAQSTGRK